jgi:hypothetical protein
MKIKEKVVRPGGLELPTFWFVARRSIQLSYGRTVHCLPSAVYSSLFFDFNLACFHIRNLRDIFLCTKHSAKLSTAAAESCVERRGADR